MAQQARDDDRRRRVSGLVAVNVFDRRNSARNDRGESPGMIPLRAFAEDELRRLAVGAPDDLRRGEISVSVPWMYWKKSVPMRGRLLDRFGEADRERVLLGVLAVMEPKP